MALVALEETTAGAGAPAGLGLTTALAVAAPVAAIVDDQEAAVDVDVRKGAVAPKLVLKEGTADGASALAAAGGSLTTTVATVGTIGDAAAAAGLVFTTIFAVAVLVAREAAEELGTAADMLVLEEGIADDVSAALLRAAGVLTTAVASAAAAHGPSSVQSPAAPGSNGNND